MQFVRLHIHAHWRIWRKTGRESRRIGDKRVEELEARKLESVYAYRTVGVRPAYRWCPPTVQRRSDQYAHRTSQAQKTPFGVRISYPFNYYHMVRVDMILRSVLHSRVGATLVRLLCGKLPSRCPKSLARQVKLTKPLILQYPDKIEHSLWSLATRFSWAGTMPRIG